jgi:hypothetical protein
MTIHRLMSVIASEQVRLRGDDPRELPASPPAHDDRNDAAAEQ